MGWNTLTEGGEQMSELKAYKMVDEKYCTDCLCVIPSEVYLKSEADKVIARHKYKRCLAMAMWCDSEANYWYDSSKVQQCWRYGHYIRWFNKWSKLAEKFKEAK